MMTVDTVVALRMMDIALLALMNLLGAICPMSQALIPALAHTCLRFADYFLFFVHLSSTISMELKKLPWILIPKPSLLHKRSHCSSKLRIILATLLALGSAVDVALLRYQSILDSCVLMEARRGKEVYNVWK